MITYRRMDTDLKPEVEDLLAQFLREDEHYLASRAAYGDSTGDGLGDALKMFLDRPDLGFVWVGTSDEKPVAACVVSYRNAGCKARRCVCSTRL